MNIVDPRMPPHLVPPGSRAKVLNGKNNEYEDLPSVVTPIGHVITRWSLTPEERLAVLKGEDLYITIYSAGMINPLLPSIGVINWMPSCQGCLHILTNFDVTKYKAICMHCGMHWGPK